MKRKEAVESHVVMVCLGDKCCKKKSKKVRERLADRLAKKGLDEKVALQETRCMHRCDGGPNISVYPTGTRYSKVAPRDTKAIVKELEEALGGA